MKITQLSISVKFKQLYIRVEKQNDCQHSYIHVFSTEVCVTRERLRLVYSAG